jgi:hypothetical protein
MDFYKRKNKRENCISKGYSRFLDGRVDFQVVSGGIL